MGGMTYTTGCQLQAQITFGAIIPYIDGTMVANAYALSVEATSATHIEDIAAELNAADPGIDSIQGDGETSIPAVNAEDETDAEPSNKNRNANTVNFVDPSLTDGGAPNCTT